MKHPSSPQLRLSQRSSLHEIHAILTAGLAFTENPSLSTRERPSTMLRHEMTNSHIDLRWRPYTCSLYQPWGSACILRSCFRFALHASWSVPAKSNKTLLLSMCEQSCQLRSSGSRSLDCGEQPLASAVATPQISLSCSTNRIHRPPSYAGASQEQSSLCLGLTMSQLQSLNQGYSFVRMNLPRGMLFSKTTSC